MSVRITCITKDNGNHYNPHEAIQTLGWVNEQTDQRNRSTRLEMYDWIKNENGTAYVKDSLGNMAYVGTAISPAGTKYVRTHADGKWSDNLLALPEC